MTKSELIAMLANKQSHLLPQDVELAVNNIVQVLTASLANGERIEIRGFGGFSTKSREPRMGRNPKTGELVSLPNRQAVHFKPGLDLKERVNSSQSVIQIIKDDN